MMESSEKVAWLSIAVNIVLVGIKASLAIYSGSIAVKADALHSLTDVLSSVIILVGIKIAKRTSPTFPYGLYKVENLVALGTSVLIAFAGYEILKEVFSGPHSPPTNIPPTIIGILATTCIAYTFSRYELQIGRQTHSPSLVADSRHILTDVLSSLVILASLAAGAVGFALDHVAAVVVVCFIARSAMGILLDSVRVLLDASLDFPTLSRIRELVLSDPKVLNINGLWARNAGRYKFIELDLSFRTEKIQQGQRISEKLAKTIQQEISQVDRVLIHYQSVAATHLTYAIPLNEDRSTVSKHFGKAPFFRMVTLTSADKTITEERIVANPHLQAEKAKGIQVAKWLVRIGTDIVLTQQDQSGRGPAYVLADGGVRMVVTSDTDADKALASAQAELQ